MVRTRWSVVLSVLGSVACSDSGAAPDLGVAEQRVRDQHVDRARRDGPGADGASPDAAADGARESGPSFDGSSFDGSPVDAAVITVTPSLPALTLAARTAFAPEDPQDEHQWPRLFAVGSALWLTYRRLAFATVTTRVVARRRVATDADFGAAEIVVPYDGYLTDLLPGSAGSLLALVDTGTASKGLWIVERAATGGWTKGEGFDSTDKTGLCEREGGSFFRGTSGGLRVVFAHRAYSSLFGCAGTLRQSSAPAATGPWTTPVSAPGFPPVHGAWALGTRLVFGTSAGLAISDDGGQSFSSPTSSLDDLAGDGSQVCTTRKAVVTGQWALRLACSGDAQSWKVWALRTVPGLTAINRRSQVAVDGASISVLWGEGADDWWTMHSPDAGASWSKPVPLPAGSSWAPNIDLVVQGKRLVIANAGVQKDVQLYEASW